MADIRTIKAGDKKFSAENFNRLVRQGRNVGKVSTDKYIRYTESPAGQHFALNKTTVLPFWRLTKHATSGSSGAGGLGILCSSGIFQYNGLRLTTSETTLPRSNFSGTNTHYWIYIATTMTGQPWSEYVHPNKAEIRVSASGGTGMDEEFSINGYFPIGYVTIDGESRIEKVVQSDMGPFCANTDSPDSVMYSFESPVRRTLERNPSSGSAHFGKWQMYDVDTVAYGYTGYPSFTPGVDGDGDLFWQYLDAQAPRSTSQKSLQRRITASGTIEQLYQFEDNNSTLPSSSDMLLYKDVSANTLRKTSKLNFMQWISASNGSTSGGIGTFVKHTELNFNGSTSGRAAGNKDHRPDFWYNYNTDSYISNRDFHTNGEVRADDIRIIDGGTSNVWNMENFLVDIVGPIQFSSSRLYCITSSDVTLWSNSYMALVAGTSGYMKADQLKLASDNEINLVPDGALQINGTSGRTITNWMRKGLFVNSAADEYTIEVLVGGIPKSLKVVAEDVTP